MALIKSLILGDDDADFIGPSLFALPAFSIPTTNGTDQIYGNGGSDIICAHSARDLIFGGSHHDAIDAGRGDDIIYGDGYNFVVGTSAPTAVARAQEGKDSINGGLGNDFIDGGGGNDGIFGGQGNDTIFGGNGNDTASAGSGNDSVDGGEGKDLLFGDGGKDSLLGGNGNDTLCGGTGTDTLDGGAGNDLIYGGGAADTVIGGDGNDTIDGGTGKDSISGGGGNDVVMGGGNADTISGDDGNDRLWGGGGKDRLLGGVGSDTLCGGSGADTIDAGNDAEADYILFCAEDSADNDIIFNFDQTDGDRIVLSGDDNTWAVLNIMVGDYYEAPGLDVKLWLASTSGHCVVTLIGAGQSFQTQAANPDGSPLSLSALNASNLLFVDSVRESFEAPDPNISLTAEPDIPDVPVPEEPWLLAWDS